MQFLVIFNDFLSACSSCSYNNYKYFTFSPDVNLYVKSDQEVASAQMLGLVTNTKMNPSQKKL